MELNKHKAKRYATELERASEQWFYDYHWTVYDQKKLENALAYFTDITKQQRQKLERESRPHKRSDCTANDLILVSKGVMCGKCMVVNPQ